MTGDDIMIVTTAEFQTNFNSYLAILANEDIVLTRDGEAVAVVAKPKVSAVDSIRGILKGAHDTDMKAIREERLAKYESND